MKCINDFETRFWARVYGSRLQEDILDARVYDSKMLVLGLKIKNVEMLSQNSKI